MTLSTDAAFAKQERFSRHKVVASRPSLYPQIFLTVQGLPLYAHGRHSTNCFTDLISMKIFSNRRKFEIMNSRTRTPIRRAILLSTFVFIFATALLFHASTRGGAVVTAESAPGVNVLGGTGGTFPGANVGAIPDGTSPCWNPGTGLP